LCAAGGALLGCESIPRTQVYQRLGRGQRRGGERPAELSLLLWHRFSGAAAAGAGEFPGWRSLVALPNLPRVIQGGAAHPAAAPRVLASLGAAARRAVERSFPGLDRMDLLISVEPNPLNRRTSSRLVATSRRWP